jgi:ribosomal protein S18 acetylase RimI-like enzyme
VIDDKKIDVVDICVPNNYHAEIAIAAAQAGGAKRLLLGVYSVNDGALAFYTRCGFRRSGTREFRAGRRTYHDLVLARDLD